MPISWPAMRVVVVIVFAVGMLCPKVATAASVTEPPGVCWTYNRNAIPSGDIPDRSLGAFCFALRSGLIDLRKGLINQAMAGFEAADAAAAGLGNPEQQGLAHDEARAAKALALEAGGNIREALTLIRQPGMAKRDVLALARASLLARHEEYDDARSTVKAAKQHLPDNWCAQLGDIALSFGPTDRLSRRAAAGGEVQWFLPSYLPWERCSKSFSRFSYPIFARTYHTPFDAKPSAGTQATIDDMVAWIGEASRSNRAQPAWTLISHVDQSCMNEAKDCSQDALDLSRRRGDAVKAALEVRLNEQGIPVPELRVDARGMAEPLVDGGVGVDPQRNRRIVLIMAFTAETVK